MQEAEYKKQNIRSRTQEAEYKKQNIKSKIHVWVISWLRWCDLMTTDNMMITDNSMIIDNSMITDNMMITDNTKQNTLIWLQREYDWQAAEYRK